LIIAFDIVTLLYRAGLHAISAASPERGAALQEVSLPGLCRQLAFVDHDLTA